MPSIKHLELDEHQEPVCRKCGHPVDIHVLRYRGDLRVWLCGLRQCTCEHKHRPRTRRHPKGRRWRIKAT